MFNIGPINYNNNNYTLVKKNRKVTPTNGISKTKSNKNKNNDNNNDNSSDFSEFLEEEIKKEKRR